MKGKYSKFENCQNIQNAPKKVFLRLNKELEVRNIDEFINLFSLLTGLVLQSTSQKLHSNYLLSTEWYLLN